ncbi:MAG: DUF1735 domain-containing protein [Rikenellaceae bacterium]
MKRVFCNLAVAVTLLFGATSCYDDVVQDYTFSSAYFAQQQPYRTVIADRDGIAEANGITVGAAIGGKLDVDLNEWAKFVIDESIITDDMEVEVMPESYYTLSDPEKMVITKVNNFIVEVDVEFTDEFYNDTEAVGLKYAIPFVLVDTSCDSVLSTMYYSIVAVKYQSKYHGTYYVQGYTAEITTGNNDGTYEYGTVVQYRNADLSQNITAETTTIARNSVSRTGQTLTMNNLSVENGAAMITVEDDGTVTVEAAPGDTAFVEGSGSGTLTYDEDTHDCVFEIVYRAESGGTMYEVSETLTRRQDPLYDLRVQFWPEE